MKQRSILKQQMLLYLVTIGVCVTLIGGTLGVLYTRHYMNETEEELVLQGEKLADTFTKAYRTGNLSNLSYELQVLEDYMQAGILMVNQSGVVVMSSPGFSESVIGKQFEDFEEYEMLLEGVMQGEVVSLQTKATPVFHTPMLIVGYPVTQGPIAGIFLCRSMPEIRASLWEVYQMGLICLLLLSVLADIVCYMTFKYVVQPLVKMNRVAKKMAEGDFAQRVTVESNDELGELCESFNLMAESLENHEKNRRDMISSISHDLRSPLTSMQGFLTAMLDGTIPQERQERYLRIVLEETNRLSRMTEGIVELSRAQSSSILLEETTFDINDVIRSNIVMQEPQLKAKRVSIKAMFAEQETLVQADRDKISRVIQNLLHNAIKFSPEAGTIEVETTLTDKKKVLISVKDEGIGISEEEQKYIFNRFYKTDESRNQDKVGSGIGLAIVREFLQAHGENITVKSEVGKGSTFLFTLKLAK